MTEAKPEVKRGRGISPVWIIPAVALVLGVWMIVHTLMSEGPDIHIRFQNAQGLEAGKTKVKFRNVQVGVVEAVRLSKDLQEVVADVKMEREVADMLRDDTRFWVVTARLGAGAVSGLDTVLSGAYIELSPGVGNTGQRQFSALAAPPLTPAGAGGLRLQLVSDKAASVGAGDSVLFRGYKVGRVESMKLDPVDSKVRYEVFIDAPFHTLVNSSVRFWDTSGVSLSAGAEGIKVEVGSLDTIILGGVAFGVPPGLPPGREVSDGMEFRLFGSRGDTMANPYRHGTFYVVSFDQSLRGLLPGAPVEFRGIPIGRVERIMLKESVNMTSRQEAELGTGALTVLVYLEPGRLELPDTEESVEELHASIERGVADGMRASLATGNLVTGSKYVDIDYYPDAEVAQMGTFAEYVTIPSVSTGLQQVQQKLFALLDKLNGLPIEGTLASATHALDEMGATLESVRVALDPELMRELAANLDAALTELGDSLQGLSPDSELYRNLNANLAGMDRVLANMDQLTRTLNTKPNAAVLGAKLPADPQPEATPR